MLHLCPYSRLSHCCWCFHSSAFVHLLSGRWSGGGCHVDLALCESSAGPRSLWCLLTARSFRFRVGTSSVFLSSPSVFVRSLVFVVSIVRLLWYWTVVVSVAFRCSTIVVWQW